MHLVKLISFLEKTLPLSINQGEVLQESLKASEYI
jgi:hypothetical protein